MNDSERLQRLMDAAAAFPGIELGLPPGQLQLDKPIKLVGLSRVHVRFTGPPQ